MYAYPRVPYPRVGQIVSAPSEPLKVIRRGENASFVDELIREIDKGAPPSPDPVLVPIEGPPLEPIRPPPTPAPVPPVITPVPPIGEGGQPVATSSGWGRPLLIGGALLAAAVGIYWWRFRR